MGRCDVHCPTVSSTGTGAGMGVGTTIVWLVAGTFYIAWWWVTGAPRPLRIKPRKYARRVHAAFRIAVAGLVAAWAAWGTIVPVLTASGLLTLVGAAVTVRVRRSRARKAAEAAELLEERKRRLAERRATEQRPVIEWTPAAADVLPTRVKGAVQR